MITLCSSRLKRAKQIAFGPLMVVVLSLSAHDSLRAAQNPWSGLGRPATIDEVKAWDIDVRADFKGLPVGRGSAEDGIDIWEARCASCHGIFAESNQVFTPLVGGTTAQDIETGRVANLSGGSYPHRTAMMKLSQISTLWDYINRAMPWDAPKSLSSDEVYAVTAYLLNLADVVKADFVLSNENMAEVQSLLPNRNGMNQQHGMWRASGKPDLQSARCMNNCQTPIQVQSSIPAYARNAHGNLAMQNRLLGAVRGTDTSKTAPTSLKQSRSYARAINVATAAAGEKPQAQAPTKGADTAVDASALAQKSNCFACHAIDKKVVGPGFKQVAKKYAGKSGIADSLKKRIKEGSQGRWGPIPMPANAGVTDAEAEQLASWILHMN